MPLTIRTHARHVALAFVLAAAPAANSQTVTELWTASCAHCHGENAEGGGAGTQSLLTDELTDPAKGLELDRRFFDATKKGIPNSGMPAFGDTMNDAKVWAMVVHLRELQEKARRARHPGVAGALGEFKSAHAPFVVQNLVASGLEVPWSVDFVPEGGPENGPPAGAMLITERPGRIRVWIKGELSEPVEGVPAVRSRGQGGLMDIAVHPDFAKGSPWVYIAYSEPKTVNGRSQGMTKIVRAHIQTADHKAYRWADQETIFEVKPEHYLDGDIHFGSRIVFSKPNDKGRRYLFFGHGERGRGELAQDLTRPNGKIFRLFDDGTIPDDNPFVANAKAYHAIWSYGHRNPQGLVIDLDGNLWDTEHGPRGGDELNTIVRAHNYGWPVVSFGMNYNDSPLVSPWPATVGSIDLNNTEGFVLPVFRWLPSIGACGLDVVRGDAFPAWKGDLIAGGLSGANVDRIRVANGKVVEWERLVHDMGRVRDVVCAPDGSVIVVLNGPDKVVRLVPPPKPAAKP